MPHQPFLKSSTHAEYRPPPSICYRLPRIGHSTRPLAAEALMRAATQASPQAAIQAAIQTALRGAACPGVGRVSDSLLTRGRPHNYHCSLPGLFLLLVMELTRLRAGMRDGPTADHAGIRRSSASGHTQSRVHTLPMVQRSAHPEPDHGQCTVRSPQSAVRSRI